MSSSLNNKESYGAKAPKNVEDTNTQDDNHDNQDDGEKNILAKNKISRDKSEKGASKVKLKSSSKNISLKYEPGDEPSTLGVLNNSKELSSSSPAFRRIRALDNDLSQAKKVVRRSGQDADLAGVHGKVCMYIHF